MSAKGAGTMNCLVSIKEMSCSVNCTCVYTFPVKFVYYCVCVICNECVYFKAFSMCLGQLRALVLWFVVIMKPCILHHYYQGVSPLFLLKFVLPT